MKIDFHSHILPKIDDGSRSVEESVKLLDLMAQDGVSVVAATPHFYCSKTSIHRFLDRRAEAYEKLKPALKPEHPKILLGAEVLYNKALVGKDALTRLALQGTDFMLLEMPYAKITEDMIDDVERMICDFDVKIMIAHIERYLNFTSYRSLARLMELDVLGQINAESLTHLRTRIRCQRLINDGYVQLLGTDMHRIDRGDATLGQAYDILESKYGKDLIETIEENSESVLRNKSVAGILD